MKMLLAVVIGGGLGAGARYLLAGQIGRWFGTDFPWGILVVNLLGCFAMGVLVETMALRWSPSPELRALLAVGVLGGFTTFSSFALDTATLAARGDIAGSAAYVAASVILSIGGFYLGLYLVRQALG